MSAPDSLEILGLGSEIVTYYLGVLAAILVVAGTYWIVGSRSGLGMRAVKDDEDAASTLGVQPLRYKMIAFVVSAAMAGLAGAVYGQYVLYLNPEATLSVTWTIDTLVVVILGGMGTMAGPLFGAGLFLILDNVLASFIGSLATTVEGVVIVLFVLFLPYGLYGYLSGEADVGEGGPGENTSAEDDAGTTTDATADDEQPAD